METVTEEHNLDTETLRLSRLPLEAAAQTVDSASQQLTGGAIKDHGGYSVVTNANPVLLFSRGSTSSSPSEPCMGTMESGVCVASSDGRPSKEQLRQLRAQCLIFRAFRNGLVPKKLHLEIALGNTYFKEDGTHGDFIDAKGKEQFVPDPSSVEEVPRPLERRDSHHPILDSSLSKESGAEK